MGIFQPIWMTKDRKKKDEAIDAVTKMSGDQNKLVQIAKTAYFDEVRFTAISMITDDETLYDIALEESQLKNISEAINRIQNQTYLEIIIKESSDDNLKNICRERLICGDIDFNNISTEETVNFFAKLDSESFNIFAGTPNFDITLKKFWDNDYCVHFSQVSEEMAKNIWLRILIKYCRYNDPIRRNGGCGYLDENNIKIYAPFFKEIWSTTPYQGFKELISQFIWPYSVEVAEYMLLNNVKINHLDLFQLVRYEHSLIEMVNNTNVLRYASENSCSEKIKDLAGKKLKRI